MFNTDLQEKIKANYNERSIKSVYSRMRRIFKLMNIEDEDLHKLVKNDGNDLLNALDNTQLSGRLVLLYQIIKVLRLADIEVPQKLIDTAKSIKKDVNKIHYSNRKNKVMNNDLNIEKMQEYFYNKLFQEEKRYSTKLKNKDGNPLELKPKKPYQSRYRYIRVVLFTLLKRCPCRLSDYTDMRYDDNDKDNFIDLNNQVMIIRNDKASRLAKTKKNTPRKIILSEDECNLLAKCKDYLNTDYVIPDVKKNINKPAKLESIETVYRHSVMAYCKAKDIKYIGGEMGIHALRSIQATNDTKDKLEINCSIDELEQILKRAHERGHSINTILKYYVYGSK